MEKRSEGAREGEEDESRLGLFAPFIVSAAGRGSRLCFAPGHEES